MAGRIHPLARVLIRELGVDEAAADAGARAVLEHLNGLPATAAVKRDLRRIAARDRNVSRSGLAASALALARELDYPWNSATSRSMCARALREALDRLDELAPAEEESDGLDQLAEQRRQRIADRARRAASADPARP